MEPFFSLLKKFIIFTFKYIWVAVLLFMIGYFVYQTSYSWEEKSEVSASNKLTSNEEVIFLVIKEEYSGAKKSGFDSLSDSLKTWEFDKRHKKLYLKYKKLLPYVKVENENKDEVTIYDQTKVMILYDRGFDSFESYSEVLSVASFPYEYHFNGEPLITVHSIETDGTVYLEFKGKKIQLKPGEDYPDVSVKGFQLSRTNIENQGVYKKDQFVPFDEKENKNKNKKKNKSNGKTSTDETPEKEYKKIELPNIHE